MRKKISLLREFDTSKVEKVIYAEAGPYFFVNYRWLYIAYLWVLCYNIRNHSLEVTHETQSV